MVHPPLLKGQSNRMSFVPPLSMGFPGSEQWRGLSFPSPGDLPD